MTDQPHDTEARNLIESIARPFPPNCDWEDQARACQAVAVQALAAFDRLSTTPAAQNGREAILPESALIDALHISPKLSCDDRIEILRKAQSLAALARSDSARVEMPAAMKAWHGGDSAPADWDGGAVLHRDGQIYGAYSRWRHAGKSYDIIAYTPATASGGGERENDQATLQLIYYLRDRDDDLCTDAADWIEQHRVTTLAQPATREDEA